MDTDVYKADRLSRKFWDIDDIRRACEMTGSHWFEPDTMRFFRSRVGSMVWQGPGGVYFVTSEQFEASSGYRAPRLFTVRRFVPETCSIETVTKFNTLSRARAVSAAKRFAAGSTEQNNTDA